MKLLFKLLAILVFLCSLQGCSALPSANSVLYESTDNANVDLLEFEYADFRHKKEKNGDDSGIGRISFTTHKIGENIRITWRNNNTGELESKTISLEKGMPFNRHDSRLRLTFNNSNQPEVYVLYRDVRAPVYFTFLGSSYSQLGIRQIYPEIKTISIKNTKK
ncbi:MAG: hypothetical protein I8H77_18615 [Comamonadaceae bacterium]|nr:hypothetical protein [Comamonadaceae bacterium]